MKPAYFVLLASLTAPAPLFAQTSVSASGGPDVASFTGVEGRSRQMNASVSLEHLARAERVRVFFDLDTGDYAEPGSWRFLAQTGGASYRFDLGEAKRDHVYAGGDVTFRRNGASWDSANFNGVGTFANLELHRGTATIRTGYRLDVRNFASVPALDQVQQTVFGSALVSFRTRTTIVAEAYAGRKHYASVPPATQVTSVPSDTPLPSHSQGQGRWGALANAALVSVAVPGSPGSTAHQLTVYGRVAQSVTDRTGVSFEVSRRVVSGEIPPALVTTPATFFEDGIYDDLFASDAWRRGVTLKSIVGSATELVASVLWLDKDYPATPAFDESGTTADGVLRSDRVMQARVGASWPLFEQRTGPVALDLITGYEYARHRSTSAWYRYTAHTIRVAFGIGY